MGILGSVFGRGLAGAAAAAGQLASKYIDQDLMAQRDQALADLRIKTEGTIRQDELNFRTDPGNLAKSNAAARTTAMAAGDTATEVETRRLGNPGLNDAARAKADADAGAKTVRDVKSANQLSEGTLEADAKRLGVIGKATTAEAVAKAEAMLPLEVKKAYAVADAASRASARNREAPGADLQAKLRIMKTELGRDLTDQERLGLFGLMKGRDPELDTVTTKKTEDDGKGNLTETTTKAVRRPGAGGTADVDPYAVPRRSDKPADKADPYSPKPAATPAGAPQPSLMERAGRSVSSGFDSVKQEGEMIALRDKIRKGEKLTPEESARANMYGIGG